MRSQFFQHSQWSVILQDMHSSVLHRSVPSAEFKTGFILGHFLSSTIQSITRFVQKEKANSLPSVFSELSLKQSLINFIQGFHLLKRLLCKTLLKIFKLRIVLCWEKKT